MWSTTKKGRQKFWQMKSRKLFSEKVKLVNFSTESDFFFEIGGNLIQRGNALLPQGMDARAPASQTFNLLQSREPEHDHRKWIRPYMYLGNRFSIRLETCRGLSTEEKGLIRHHESLRIWPMPLLRMSAAATDIAATLHPFIIEDPPLYPTTCCPSPISSFPPF